MDDAIKKLLLEQTDEAHMPIRLAVKRDAGRRVPLSRSTRGNVHLKPGRNITMAVSGAECYRIKDSDEQHTRQPTRKRRVPTTRY